MKSSIKVSRGGRSITFRGVAARAAFEGMTGQKMPEPDPLQKYVDYLKNVGGPIALVSFDDDWEPIGLSIRARLVAAGKAFELNGRIGLVGHAC